MSASHKKARLSSVPRSATTYTVWEAVVCRRRQSEKVRLVDNSPGWINEAGETCRPACFQVRKVNNVHAAAQRNDVTTALFIVVGKL